MTTDHNRELLLEAEHISLEYEKEGRGGRFLALSDVSMKVYRGDFICILGPSGCGKSTFLNIIAGLLQATQGSLLAGGKPVRGVDPRRAMVFQTPTLFPWLDIYGNTAYGPRSRGIGQEETDRRVRKYLKLTGLSEFAHSKPYELSGGMKQRAALARTLVNDPDMLLLDEPFGALDAFTRVTMQDLIRNVWKETGITCIMITHDVDEALTLGTRLFAMSPSPGKIMKEFAVSFTNEMKDSEGDLRYSPEYVALRKEILGLMKVQGSDPCPRLADICP